uniref:Cytochrome P450 2U1-like n=1 Tax=Phallusia mammillata TaxID=59560 RepID=A0A6F9DB95_9ASCI|nr:cytochrome P450 2U1-like [Phallusia mammillata]
MFLAFNTLCTLDYVFWGICFALFALLFQRWHRKPCPNFPLGPRGIPVLGVLPFAGNYPERKIRQWSLDTYGPVMSVRLGFNDVLFLNSYEAIQQAFVKQANAFSGRPQINILQDISQNQGIIMVDHEGFHKALRLFVVQKLKQFGYGKRGMEDVCNDEIDCLINRFRQKIGQRVDITTDLSIVTANVIFNLTCGRRCNTDDHRFRRCIWLVHKSFTNTDDSLYIAMLTLFDSLKYIPPFRGARERFLLYQNELINQFKKEVNEHRNTFDPSDLRDFIDAFLLEQAKEKQIEGKNSKFTDGELFLCVRDLFGGGVETIVTMVRWSILCLLHYTQFQDILVEEILRVLGPLGKPSMALKKDMPMMFAFLQEVYRYRPVVTLNIPHMTTEDTQLYGYNIPKGTRVTANFWAAHFDPQIWKDPFKFDPYRHIDEEGNFVPSEKVIPFSMGPRFCLGANLGKMEVFSIFVRILQNFKIMPSSDQLPSLDEGTTMIAFSPLPFDIVLKERL